MAEVAPGNFVLTHGKSWVSHLISFGEWLRFGNTREQYWTHCALIVDAKGALIEAQGGGVKRNTIGNYVKTHGDPVQVVETGLDAEGRAKAVRYAESRLGQEYGFAQFVSIGFTCLTGLNFEFGLDGTEICSQLVANALMEGGVIFKRDSAQMTPADLARHFHI